MLMLVRLGGKVNIAWHVAGVAGGLLVGVALSGTLHLTAFSLAYVVASAALFLASLVNRRLIFILFSLLLGVVLGLWRGSLEQSALRSYLPYYGKTVYLQGRVSEDASYSPRGDQRLRLDNIKLNDQSLHGQVWLSSGSPAKLQRSDIALFQGKLGTGFGNLPASMFEARLVKIERPQPGDVALHVRNWFSGGIDKAIPKNQAGLASGYLVGQRSTLEPALDNQLKIVGLTHAVVASGYNLTILMTFARRLLEKVSRYLTALVSAAMAGGFMLVTGFSPSMTRAGLVTGLGLLAWYYGRKIHPAILLLLAAGITAIFNPAYMWGDIGWYLSFSAFGGVLILAPLLHRYYWGDSRPSALRQIFVDTLAAQIATMPIMIFAFGQYSPYALLANLLVLPFIPITMLLTFVGGLAGVTLPSLAHWFGLPATIILKYMIGVVGWVANLPGAEGSLTFGAISVAFCYMAMAVLVIFLRLKTDFRFGNQNILIKEET